MTKRLHDVIRTFRSVDPEMRLELLLDYSRKLPALPPRLHEARDAGLNRVHECMTPVYLFVERSNSSVVIHADVADEAPTVRGFLSAVIHALEGASPDEVTAVPLDLVEQLKLNDVLRMNRSVGLSAILTRIRNEVQKSA